MMEKIEEKNLFCIEKTACDRTRTVNPGKIASNKTQVQLRFLYDHNSVTTGHINEKEFTSASKERRRLIRNRNRAGLFTKPKQKSEAYSELRRKMDTTLEGCDRTP